MDDEHTAKLLFKNKCFGGQSVTLLPNNKTQAQNIEEQLVRKADEIAKGLRGTAIPAYKLIRFDPSISKPIMFIFGKTVN